MIILIIEFIILFFIFHIVGINLKNSIVYVLLKRILKNWWIQDAILIPENLPPVPPCIHSSIPSSPAKFPTNHHIASESNYISLHRHQREGVGVTITLCIAIIERSVPEIVEGYPHPLGKSGDSGGRCQCRVGSYRATAVPRKHHHLIGAVRGSRWATSVQRSATRRAKAARAEVLRACHRWVVAWKWGLGRLVNVFYTDSRELGFVHASKKKW